MLFAVRPDGGIPSLPQIVVDLSDAPSAWFAAFPLVRLEGAGGEFPGRGFRLLCGLDLADSPVDFACCRLSHLIGDVGVDVQCGAAGHVPDHRGEGLDVHSVFQGHGGKQVPEIVKSDAGQVGVFQQYLQSAVGGAGIDGQLWLQRIGEYPIGECRFFPLSQTLYRTGWQDDFTSTSVGFGVPGSKYATLLHMNGALDVQHSMLCVEVLPAQAADLTQPQAGGQFGVEKVVPDIVRLNRGHERIELFIVEDLLGRWLLLGGSDVRDRIPGDQPKLLRCAHRPVEQGVDTVYHAVGQLVSVFFVLADAAPLLQVGVQLLYFRRGNLVERPVAEGGLDVEVSVAAVGLKRAGAHSACHVLGQPAIQPLAHRHGTVLGQIYALVGVDLLSELCGQLLLRGSVDVVEDGVAVFLVAHHDAALPATVVPLAHHTVAGRSALCHLLLTSSPNITVVIIHTLSHDPDAQPKAQDEILGCCDTVDLML